MAPPAQQQPQFSHFLEDDGAQPTHFVEDGQGAPPPPTPSSATHSNSSSEALFGSNGEDTGLLSGHNGFQQWADKIVQDSGKEPQYENTFDRFLRGVRQGSLGVVAHPIKAVQGMAEQVPNVIDPSGSMATLLGTPTPIDTAKSIMAHPAEAAGQIAAGPGMGAITGGLIKGTGELGGMVRDAAIGDANAAAVRGLKVPPGSPKMQRTISNVETARPYLQGVKSQAELQTRVPQAKAEIWGPYQQAVDAGKNVQVAGPDGPTTIGQLEQERLQLSALNRGLKMREPEAIQLAQQKGMNQAQLLAREKAIQGALDPELTKMGIKPQEIRKTFGSVAQIGQKVSGKSNIIEPEQPYGFSKLKDISLTKPLSNIPTILSAGRDIAAGRYLSASPIDTGIREGFRTAGPKPDLGRLTSTLQPPPPRALLGPGARPMPAPAYDGRVAGYAPPPVYAGTNASRLGRLLPAEIPARELPLSSYHEIFPDQIPQARVLDYIRRSQ